LRGFTLSALIKVKSLYKNWMDVSVMELDALISFGRYWNKLDQTRPK